MKLADPKRYSKAYAEKYSEGDFTERHEYINVLEKLTTCKVNKALDLGCGTGRYFSYINCETLFGVDYSINMLDVAKNHIKKEAAKYSNLELIENSIFDFLVETNIEFDLIYCIGVLGYGNLKEIYENTNENLISIIYNNLSTNGMFFVAFSSYSIKFNEVCDIVKPVFNHVDIVVQEFDNKPSETFVIGKKLW